MVHAKPSLPFAYPSPPAIPTIQHLFQRPFPPALHSCPGVCVAFPITPPPPRALPPPGDLVDASAKTDVTVSANAFHESECNDTGCSADLTRDQVDVSDGTSRWSCKFTMLDDNCKLRFSFSDPVDIVRLDIAFYKGDIRTRSFFIKTFAADGTGIATNFVASGTTADFESFEINSQQTSKLYIAPRDPDKLLWFSMKEVSQTSELTLCSSRKKIAHGRFCSWVFGTTGPYRYKVRSLATGKERRKRTIICM